MKFLQIGSANGDDFCYHSMKDYDIELGILVEPLTVHHEQLSLQYKDMKNIHIESCAISPFEEVTKLKLHKPKDNNLLNHTSFNKEQLLSHGITEDKIEEILYPCMTINQMLDKYNITELDYLFVDTEGLDGEILKSIDFKKYKIHNIIFEHIHIGGPKEWKVNPIMLELQRSGYVFPLAANPRLKMPRMSDEEFAKLPTQQQWNTHARLQHQITTCISSNNNLEYLKLAVKSVRQNAYFKNMPIIVYAENCTDGTDEWLANNDYNLEYYIEKNKIEKGIGGGMDFCVNKAKTQYVNIIHSDMWIAPNQDFELLKCYHDIEPNVRLITSSFRIQPHIFPNDPKYRPGTVFVDKEEFGQYHHNFNHKWFDEWATKFADQNDSSVRKGGGAGFFCRKADYEWIGGNDPLFAPASWEDKDLFIRMQLEGYKFKMITKSVVWHFSARGSWFRDEAKDQLNSKSNRQQTAEEINVKKFIKKWGRLPEEDEETFVKPIYGTNVKTRL